MTDIKRFLGLIFGGISLIVSPAQIKADNSFTIKADAIYTISPVLKGSKFNSLVQVRITIPQEIPGVQFKKIAVYDVRYNNCRDLQENIDIGMSRSKDSGQTWTPMKIIIDMGEWGGKP